MIKSMTGFSKNEATEHGVKATVELKSLNGRYLEINTRLPKSISHKELEIRDLIKKALSRGSVSLTVTIEYDENVKPFFINEAAFESCYKNLLALRKKNKIRDDVSFEHVLHFSAMFTQNNGPDTGDMDFTATMAALREALKTMDRMRTNEGKQINNDILPRIKKITNALDKIEALGIERIPQERDRLRQKIAQLFESDEIDENRIQMEVVMQANKLDISEECVRLRSHIKFFLDALKGNVPVGQKITFLLQEMHREINTIGSKADNAEISQLVVSVKEEMERIREQMANVE